MSSLWSVDFPNPNDLESPWENYGLYRTKEEALLLIRQLCGADEEGNINVLTEMTVEDEQTDPEEREDYLNRLIHRVD